MAGFQSWVPDSVFSAGGGRASVEAWYTTALDIEEGLSGVVDADVHLFVADVVKFFDTVDRGVLDLVLSSLGCQVGSVMPILSIMLMFGCGLNFLLVLVFFGLVMVGFLKAAP